MNSAGSQGFQEGRSQSHAPNWEALRTHRAGPPKAQLESIYHSPFMLPLLARCDRDTDPRTEQREILVSLQHLSHTRKASSRRETEAHRVRGYKSGMARHRNSRHRRRSRIVSCKKHGSERTCQSAKRSWAAPNCQILTRDRSKAQLKYRERSVLAISLHHKTCSWLKVDYFLSTVHLTTAKACGITRTQV